MTVELASATMPQHAVAGCTLNQECLPLGTLPQEPGPFVRHRTAGSENILRPSSFPTGRSTALWGKAGVSATLNFLFPWGYESRMSYAQAYQLPNSHHNRT